ncbi:MAG: DUF1549 and DUF1553 domain-containing protein [Verrucomicrobiota bacterium]|nr:DUF1549 and DUF1553 domain-containing protein [Verrucomicrobiota bacterium]
MQKIAIALVLSYLTTLGQAEDTGIKKSPKRWPFIPVSVVVPPKVTNTNWVNNPIDAFILSKLEAKDIEPAPLAKRRTLIRRLYFDLLGVPPEPGAVNAFINDRHPMAYSRLVDQLLNDPRYGERWGRYWLDLARYADTAGYEGDPDMPHAWRYRDYVIDSLNSDKPYDLFIREQIAGDEFNEIMGAGELPGMDAERTVALTFLRLAPFTEPRGDRTRHELLSEMTSTVSSVFLGLTMGCAQCHDHKYDAIPIDDFYRMQAFFSTVQIPPPLRGDGFQIGGPLPARFYLPREEELINDIRTRIQRDASEAKSKLADLTKELEQRTAKNDAGFGLQVYGGNLGNDYIFDTANVTDGKPHYSVVLTNGKEWAFSTDGRPAKSLGSKSGSNTGKWYGDLSKPDYLSIGDYTEGTGQSKNADHKGTFAEILIYGNSLNDEQLELLHSYVQQKFHGMGGEKVSQPPTDGLRFWLDASDLDANAETPNPSEDASVHAWVDKVTGVRLIQNDPSLQPKLTRLGKAPALYFDNSFMSAKISRGGSVKFLDDQIGTMVILFSADHTGEGYGFEVGGSGQMVGSFINPTAVSGRKLRDQVYDYSNDLFTKRERDLFYSLENRGRFVKQHLKRLSPQAMSLRHSFGPPYEPGVPVTTVKLRGEYDNHGKVVKAGFPSIVSGNTKPAAIRLDPFKRWPTRSRRMALANWIASSDNPLTARVMMNRLWYRHFGRGIVKTPSDFGKLSGGATHPELLDWLARQFVASRWSLKAMHHLIVTSSTYQQSSFHDSEVAQNIDPLNDLWWRFEQRRLDAEAIRDNVLSVSGRLNSELYGLPIFPPLPGDIAETVKYSENKWATQVGQEGRKRSIYIYQQRTLNMPFMQAFDSTVCDESRPRRRTSVTPLQALSLFNGDFVNEEAKALANRVYHGAGDSVLEQIRLAYRYVLSRPPSKEEASRFEEFLKQSNNSTEALNGFCRVLLNTNEFVYID